MNIFRSLALLLAAPTLTFTQPLLAQDTELNSDQQLALSVKPSVVRIWNPCYGLYENKQYGFKQDFDLSFLGTGFFINPDGYIVTSNNIIQEEKDCLDRLVTNIQKSIVSNYGKDIPEKEIKQALELEKDRSYHYNNLVVLPNYDIDPFPVTIKESSNIETNQTDIGDDVAIIKIPVTNAPTLELGDSSQVNIQDRVLTVGYPTNTTIDLTDTYTDKSLYEASIQEGNIASTAKRLKSGYPVLQVDIQAKKGNGGSPLINMDGKVIGMLVPRESWISDEDTIPLAIPTDTIQEFINSSGTNNDYGGVTNKMYKEGLDLFVQKKYENAKKSFLDVKDIFKVEGVSAHSEVQKLIDKIEKIEAERWDKPWKDPTYIVTAGLILAAGVAGGVAYFWLKQKSNLVQAPAGIRGSATNGNSVFTSSFKSNGKGKKCFIEMEYKGQIQRFQLDQDEHRLGRDSSWSDFDLPTSWEVISRHHAILQKEGEDYRIFDGDRNVSSRNGLWINDDYRVDPKEGYLLNNGDRLKIGQDASEQILLTYYNPNSEQANLKTTVVN